MPIEVVTPSGEIQQYIEEQLKLKVEVLINKLSYIGEGALKVARTRTAGSYTDRTGNLRNSTGYVIAVDGQVTTRTGFDSEDENGARDEAGLAFAEELARTTNGKAVLVVCAGKNYATYVSARGYDVLDSAELEAKALAEKLLKI